MSVSEVDMHVTETDPVMRDVSKPKRRYLLYAVVAGALITV